MSDTISTELQEQFKQTSELAKNLPKGVTDQEKLQLYAHFKQANEGDVNTLKPGIMDFVGRAKWDEWKKLEGTSKKDAMEKYIKIYENLNKKYVN
ncbi:hypothetical protein IWW36_003732 [Coemansia brasiliensis]|uniref:ACB domain-containing protein n=1 Tax=Coemansia brasiliensis TaxID=2650707 RepID=A0A9W8I9M4_9FUNG|nr:hypothetical protein IWW36_003732 [Coemansia brasiliensis]